MGGLGTIPWEAMDYEHPDHDWWVDGAGRCYDKTCPEHKAPAFQPKPIVADRPAAGTVWTRCEEKR